MNMESPYAPAWNEFLKEIGGEMLMTGTTVEQLFQDSDVNAQNITSRYEIPPPDDSVNTEDITLQDCWARIYTPPSETDSGSVAVFIHGGGWIMGSPNIEDAACRRISKSSGMKVVSIGYRLAPKFKFPTGLDDCVRVTLWVLDHFSVPSVIIMGGSAGANLAFGVALKFVDAGIGEKVKGVLALVPATVHPEAVPEDKRDQYTALHENANNTVNTLASMGCFLDAYAAPPHDKYFSVLLHPRLRDLKKVYIVECGTDTLRDDARLMGEALKESGVPLMYDAYPGYPHYFWSYPSPVLAEASKTFHENMFRALAWLDHE
ncbi:hypothetical protein CBS147343_10342 [Aspergillus niger]|nr:hypothetical protein CBS11350_6982 [Aspergillus niger]KAI2895371.1 hypothetical protein CBS11852_4721 [Aspergillus niger]KAI3057180.1 hypothetical protein CBS147343_10342 [Aspergillus niger]